MQGLGLRPWWLTTRPLSMCYTDEQKTTAETSAQCGFAPVGGVTNGNRSKRLRPWSGADVYGQSISRTALLR